MTFRETVEILKSAGIDSAVYDARELWKKYAEKAIPFPPRPTDSTESEQFILAVKRREAREPLQYILGTVGFYREEYEVTRDCLIPRAETEMLVDEAVSRLKPGARFLDLCCGSGCIAISVLKNTVATSAAAVDISESALKIAKKNSKRNGVQDRIEFMTADVLSLENIAFAEKFDAILSNPPYVTSTDYETLEPEIFHEPKIAFVGGNDGMDFYNRIVPLLSKLLDKDGFAAFEIGYDQANAILKLAEENSLKCEIKKDYSGIDRVAVMTFI